MSKRLVITLGGNALGKTPEQQLKLVIQTASTIVDLIEDGYEVVLGHGNGPQVGMVNVAFDYGCDNNYAPAMPLSECTAMTQGYIGYQLQQAVTNELRKRNIPRNCLTVVTQVLVNENDPAFQKPTKPIGMYYSKEEADAFIKEKGYTFKFSQGKGYRRIVPSPLPEKILEVEPVKQLMSSGNIVITVGGGGIPVIDTPEGYKGIPAVIDKDLASSLLACCLEADMLVILTNVEKVCLNFNQPDQRQLDHLTVSEAEKYLKAGQFGVGSMLPKVESCIKFLRHNPEGKALITSLEKAREALNGKTGTYITY